jgi:hypothetical protein
MIKIFKKQIFRQGTLSFAYWHILHNHIKCQSWPIDERPRPKSGKWRLNLHGTILEGKSIGSNFKKNKKKKTHGLENQDAS